MASRRHICWCTPFDRRDHMSRGQVAGLRLAEGRRGGGPPFEEIAPQQISETPRYPHDLFEGRLLVLAFWRGEGGRGVHHKIQNDGHSN